MSPPSSRPSRFRAALADFFETCDVFLCPTLCSPPLRIGELNTMSEDLSHIAPILRRYMPGTAMFNMSGQPAMSVPLAWNKAGLPLGMMFSARFGDEATLFRLAGQLEQARPWKDKLPPVSLNRPENAGQDKTQPYSEARKDIRAAAGTPIPLTELVSGGLNL